MEGGGEVEEKKKKSNLDELKASLSSFELARIWISFSLFAVFVLIILPLNALVIYAFMWPYKYLHKPTWMRFKKLVAYTANFEFVTCARCMGMKVNYYGDDMSTLKEERCLILPNHLGLLDHFLLMTSVHDFGIQVVGKWMYVIYNIWIYTPLGWLWYLHGNYFVKETSSKNRQQNMENMKSHFNEVYHENDLRWIIIYPEGSRLFLLKKSNLNFEKKNNLPTLNNCAYPRLGAVHNVLNVVGPSDEMSEMAENRRGPPIKYLVDVTLGYPNGQIYGIDELAMHFLKTGKYEQFSIHYKIYKLEANMKKEEDLKKFLYDLYQKKDKLLDDFYKTGTFPGPGKTIEYPSDASMIISHVVNLIFSFFIIKLVFGFLF